jgi:CheY-like chemotaxis protein
MKKILIVDDIPAHLDLLEVILARADCSVLRADDGPTALQLAHEEHPDLLYLDVEMPHLTGGEVCRMLKADPLFKSVPVILVSARDYRELAGRCGADLFLQKPVDEPTILATVAKFLNLAARREDRRVIEWPLTFWREGSSHEGHMSDLSQSGFFLEAPALQAVGARLAITFQVPTDPTSDPFQIVGEAIVVRLESNSRRGMGCRFFRISQNARASLDSYLARGA